MSYWTDEEISILKKWYGNIPNDDLLLKIPNHTRQAMMRKASYLNLKRCDLREIHKKYSIDYKFFEVPNIGNSYWAGFITADGHLSRNKALHAKGVKIVLQARDKEVLEQFKQDVKYNGQVKDFANKDGYIYSKIDIWGVREWHTDLDKHWNITPNKTVRLQPPNITDEKFLHSYLIGFLDGDGTIFKTLNNGFNIGWCGNYCMMKWLTEYLYSYEDKAKYKKPVTLTLNGNSKVNYRINYNRLRGKHIYELLSRQPTPYRLARKWRIMPS